MFWLLPGLYCFLRIIYVNYQILVLSLSLWIGQTTNQGWLALSLEFHHPEVLSGLPSLVATVLSRSTFDWTEVSLSLLSFIAIGCNRQPYFSLKANLKIWFSDVAAMFQHSNNRKVFVVRIFTFQGSKVHHCTSEP